jgi:hypothetical protein
VQQNEFENLKASISKIEDLQEIQQLQHRYIQNLALFRADKIIGLFAQKVPDVSFEGGGAGVFEGLEGIKRFFKVHDQFSKAPGLLIEHYAICPVIEIAKDGKTARGTWLSPGINCVGPSKVQHWIWGKYACDYIKEDGKWKIWHLHWFPTFEAEFEKGWLYESKDAILSVQGVELAPPDKPPTYLKLFDPEGKNYLVPEPPEPY